MRSSSFVFRLFRALRLLTRSSRLFAVLQNLAIGRKPSKQFWTWEVYGLGSATKDLLDLPPNQTLKCGSDHGILLETEPSEQEINLGSDLFVTWSKWRADLMFPDGRRVVQMQHPWISFRHKYQFRKPRGEDSRGTLAFVPHSVPGLISEDFKLSTYLDELLSLPVEFHPISVCFHVHDVSFENIMLTLQMGIGVETVGSSLSPTYTSRFYNMIRDFKFATSPSIGSQLFYCQEFGVEYFLFDPSKRFQRQPLNYDGPIPDVALQSRLEELFTLEGIWQNKDAKDLIVSDALGLTMPKPTDSRLRELLSQY